MSDQLTNREKQAAVLAAVGLTNPQIGQRLNLKESTVRQYLHSVREKTGTWDRQRLIEQESPK